MLKGLDLDFTYTVKEFWPQLWAIQIWDSRFYLCFNLSFVRAFVLAGFTWKADLSLEAGPLYYLGSCSTWLVKFFANIRVKTLLTCVEFIYYLGSGANLITMKKLFSIIKNLLLIVNSHFAFTNKYLLNKTKVTEDEKVSCTSVITSPTSYA